MPQPPTDNHEATPASYLHLGEGSTMVLPLRSPAEYLPRRSWRTWLFGRPLPTADAPGQTVGRTIGLAIFASDALSSTAYATQEILFVLAAAGAAAIGFALPIAGAIVALMLLVTLSYEQTIHAYPGGGGAYIVARDNLGELPAQVAGAALLLDYVLTVSVSVSAGAAQLASAFPRLLEHRVAISVTLVLLLMVLNLRGARESGSILAIPTYFFLAAMGLTLGVGFFRYLGGTLGPLTDLPVVVSDAPLRAVGAFLILHAFSNGTAALTGIEAISNGVTAFREPRSRNAGLTLLWMSGILGTLFLGITFLALRVGAVASEQETVISQLARAVFPGRGWLYFSAIGASTLILAMAANTAFAGFPRLSALQAEDGFLPRQLTYRGSRLVFSRGIVVLALASSFLIVVFQGSVSALIPLYAIGVFLSFTLSQAGMTRRWWKIGRLSPGTVSAERASVLRPARGWRFKMVLNGLGAMVTLVVTGVFAVTKFTEGAWMILLMVPILVAGFFAVRAHYREAAAMLSLPHHGPPVRSARHRVIIPISAVHRGTLEALRYARSLSQDVTAVHVSLEHARADELRARWAQWGEGVRLVILESPYRLLLEPLLDYIERISRLRQPHEILTIVVPQFVPRRRWHNLLHAQTALFLRLALLFQRGIIITSVPYQLAEEPAER